MIGQVRGSVSGCINEVHPSKRETREESNGTLDDGCEVVASKSPHVPFAACVLYH